MVIFHSFLYDCQRVLIPTGSAMRPRLYKCGADCAKRCDENEEICNKRLGGGPRLTVEVSIVMVAL
jgi:hypothetical protein